MRLIRLAEGVPAYRMVNTCTRGRYRMEKEVVADPRRDVVLQHTRFVALTDRLADYHVYVLLAPHLANRGDGNTAWVGDYKGVPMLFAERNGHALALASSVPWRVRSVGCVGFSDGWQDLARHKQLRSTCTRAENGNVALTGEVDLAVCGGTFVLAVGFGHGAPEAGYHALASLREGFDTARAGYIDGWQRWQRSLLPLGGSKGARRDLYHVSTAVLRTHEAKHLHGGMIASLSVPWGFAKGDDDLGGYHLVWPRDLVEAAGALLAVGAAEDAGRVLQHLALHARGRDRRAPGGRRPRRRVRRTEHGHIPARDRRCVEREHRAMDLRARYRAGA